MKNSATASYMNSEYYNIFVHETIKLFQGLLSSGQFSKPYRRFCTPLVRLLILPFQLHVFSDKWLVPNKLRPLWEHQAGPKTIFFWAPTTKWGLVIAGLADLNRPVEKISIPLCGALSVSGMLYGRYAMVIHPINWNLFGVNMFVTITNLYPFCRAVRHEMQLKKEKEIEKKP